MCRHVTKMGNIVIPNLIILSIRLSMSHVTFSDKFYFRLKRRNKPPQPSENTFVTFLLLKDLFFVLYLFSF